MENLELTDQMDGTTAAVGSNQKITLALQQV
jgi:hypothetical protein